MGAFADRLKSQKPAGDRRWLFVPYDQLDDQRSLLAEQPPEETGIVLVESPWKGRRRPYHRQKLALVLANLRHFALEQQERGVQVVHRVVDGPYAEALRPVIEEVGSLEMMRPAERELRQDLAELAEDGGLVERPNTLWATEREDFEGATDGPPWRMDAFYRAIRQRYGWLMEDGKPVGGRYSFDGDNREVWKGEPEPPEPPRFEPDDVTREVRDLVDEVFHRHPGQVDLSSLPTTAEDATTAWEWALEHCMESFGPYEDAMTLESRSLFHTRISPLVNLGRLTPAQVVEDVLATDAPLSSREGFLRQVVGWREFVRHVHEATDGFRRVAEEENPEEPAGDGGFAAWKGEGWAKQEELPQGAAPNYLGVSEPLPPAFWGEASGLRCLDEVVESVWAEAWSHHITRLMILSNLASLLDVAPRQLTDWFWVAYVDAFDWVVEPNVLGMGAFALGPAMTTKPYVSGAAYIHRMSDYCSDCAFHPKETCPITHLYWAYLGRHQAALEGNQRVAMPLRSLAKRSDEKKERDREVFEITSEALREGRKLRPEDF